MTFPLSGDKQGNSWHSNVLGSARPRPQPILPCGFTLSLVSADHLPGWLVPPRSGHYAPQACEADQMPSPLNSGKSLGSREPIRCTDISELGALSMV